MLSQVGEAFLQFDLDLLASGQQLLPRRHVMRLREHRVARNPADDLTGQGIEVGNRFDFIVEQLDADGVALRLGRENVDHVAPHPIGTLRQVELIAGVLHLGEAPQDRALVDTIAPREMQHHAEIRLGIAETVDRRDRCNDDGIRSLDQCLGR